MADWTTIFGRSDRANGYPASGTYYAAVTADVSANTKGNWSQVVASTPFDGFLSAGLGFHSFAGDYLTDIGIGADGSEVVIVNNIISSYMTGGILSHRLIPLFVPAGTRIAFRAQCSTSTSRYHTSSCVIISAGGLGRVNGLSVCDTYGANTADSGGTSIDPGGTADTKGSWTQITASLSRAIKGFCIGIGNANNTARTAYYWALDIGIGANPNEVAIVTDYPLQGHSLLDYMSPEWSPFFPIALPAGTRISARAACSGNDATDRLFDIVIYTFS